MRDKGMAVAVAMLVGLSMQVVFAAQTQKLVNLQTNEESLGSAHPGGVAESLFEELVSRLDYRL